MTITQRIRKAHHRLAQLPTPLVYCLSTHRKKKKAISSSLTGELHLSIILKPSPWNLGFTGKDIHALVFERSLNDEPRVKTKAGKIQQYLVKAKDGLGGEARHKSELQEFKARGQEGLG